jgi:peptidoglycan/LPS O-acetylase OafA/YrhL
MKKILILDLARGAAVLMVLVGHLGLLFSSRSLPPFWQWVWYKAWVNGGYGVSLFFVLSGFLITGLIAQSPGGLFKPNLRLFYARRAGRILPLLFLFCALGLALNFLAPLPVETKQTFFAGSQAGSQPILWFSIAAFWFNWLRVFSHQPVDFFWGILWSLSVEEQFYFFYPLALRILASKRNLVLFLGAFVALGPIAQGAAYWLGLNHLTLHYNSFNGFSLIALGSLLYLARGRWAGVLSQKPALGWLFTAAGFALIWKVYFHQPYFADYWGNRFDDLEIGLGLALFLLGALGLKAFNSGKIWGLLGLTGRLSYGIYLYQCVVFCLLAPFLTGRNEFIGFLAAYAAVLGLAALSFYFFERPANQFIRRKLGGTD